MDLGTLGQERIRRKFLDRNISTAEATHSSLRRAKERADMIAKSTDYQHFVEMIRSRFPWRFERIPLPVLERDFLRIVDHHLEYLVPLVQPYLEPKIRRVLDFGCGSGGSAIALAMAHPEIRFCGTDIDEREILVARERAKLYGVADRCEFFHVSAGQPLPFPDESFDFSLCSSVIEYAVERSIRKFCVQEMVRLVNRRGLLFFSVPNRLYPFEIHSGKWGWNYFPKLLHARTVDSTVWEVEKLARPAVLRLHRTPIAQLFRPWSNFCLRRESPEAVEPGAVSVKASGR